MLKSAAKVRYPSRAPIHVAKVVLHLDFESWLFSKTHARMQSTTIRSLAQSPPPITLPARQPQHERHAHPG